MDMGNTGCHQFNVSLHVSRTIRPTRVVTAGYHSIGYTEHTECRQLHRVLCRQNIAVKSAKSANQKCEKCQPHTMMEPSILLAMGRSCIMPIMALSGFASTLFLMPSIIIMFSGFFTPA
jgi:hypothetical protein